MADRRAGCPATGSEPVIRFDGTTPYEDYVHASVLHALQRPVSEAPQELSFLVTTQVMEMYFGLLVHEWRHTQQLLRADDLRGAVRVLGRSVLHLRALNAAWAPIGRLTPREFNTFRAALGDGSGFQSGAYRHLEFLLGDKSTSMLVPHRAVPELHDALAEALAAPSLYDDVIALLARRGHAISAATLERDPTLPYQASPDVEQAWAGVYASGDELVELGEVLTDIAEHVSRWRFDHLMATRRAMGAKRGTGGSAGVAWLEKRARRDVFPELWTARSHV